MMTKQGAALRLPFNWAEIKIGGGEMDDIIFLCKKMGLFEDETNLKKAIAFWGNYQRMQ